MRWNAQTLRSLLRPDTLSTDARNTRVDSIKPASSDPAVAPPWAQSQVLDGYADKVFDFWSKRYTEPVPKMSPYAGKREAERFVVPDGFPTQGPSFFNASQRAVELLDEQPDLMPPDLRDAIRVEWSQREQSLSDDIARANGPDAVRLGLQRDAERASYFDADVRLSKIQTLPLASLTETPVLSEDPRIAKADAEYVQAFGALTSYDREHRHPIVHPDRDLALDPPTAQEKRDWLMREDELSVGTVQRQSPRIDGLPPEAQMLHNEALDRGTSLTRTLDRPLPITVLPNDQSVTMERERQERQAAATTMKRGSSVLQFVPSINVMQSRLDAMQNKSEEIVEKDGKRQGSAGEAAVAAPTAASEHAVENDASLNLEKESSESLEATSKSALPAHLQGPDVVENEYIRGIFHRDGIAMRGEPPGEPTPYVELTGVIDGEPMRVWGSQLPSDIQRIKAEPGDALMFKKGENGWSVELMNPRAVEQAQAPQDQTQDQAQAQTALESQRLRRQRMQEYASETTNIKAKQEKAPAPAVDVKSVEAKEQNQASVKAVDEKKQEQQKPSTRELFERNVTQQTGQAPEIKPRSVAEHAAQHSSFKAPSIDELSERLARRLAPAQQQQQQERSVGRSLGRFC